jgi:hypothetical protein
MQDTKPIPTTRPFERFLAVLEAAICLIVTIFLWLSLSSTQAMWPLPGLYFIEMAALGLLSEITFLRGNPGSRFVPWAAIGAISAFSILGAWSVGLFYLPVALILVVISVTWDVRNKQHLLAHLGICLISGIVQAAVMLTVIRIFFL